MIPTSLGNVDTQRRQATDGIRGLSMIRSRKPDIVLMDLIMPGMGGKNCLLELLKIDPDIKVLISSGFTLDEPGSDPVLIQAKGFIQKPYNLRNMLRRMREVIARSR